MLDAALKSRAVAIISAHYTNGTIVALSSEARQEGLCKGMKVSLARKMSHSTRLLLLIIRGKVEVSFGVYTITIEKMGSMQRMGENLRKRRQKTGIRRQALRHPYTLLGRGTQ